MAFSFSALASQCPSKTIPEVAKKSGKFNTILTAVKVAGLEEVLQSEGPFTLFAPTDEAFAKIPSETLSALLNDKEALKNVLLYHVVSGAVPASVAVTLESAEMVNGDTVQVSIRDQNLFINDSKVIATDIKASNGIIHVIDTVLIP